MYTGIYNIKQSVINDHLIMSTGGVGIEQKLFLRPFTQNILNGCLILFLRWREEDKHALCFRWTVVKKYCQVRKKEQRGVERA